MSYILDALKRADAERERGQVPGLHAHPLREGGAGERDGRAPRWALWAGIALGAVVLAALAWRMGADANAPVPAPVQPPPPENLAVAVSRPAPTPAPTPASTPVTPPTAAPEPIVPSYAPPPATARPHREDQRAPEANTPASAAPAAPAPAAAVRIPLFAELPATLRGQLPALAVGGSVYSDDAASRFIMLNGEVVKEGGQPAPGLVVERIEARSAVLRFKGERFRLPF